MIPMTLAEIGSATGGTLCDVPDPGMLVTGPAASDSREVVPGGMFAAVTGAHVNGHDFAADAIAAGAACLLASRPAGVPAVLVTDVVAALGRGQAVDRGARGDARTRPAFRGRARADR